MPTKSGSAINSEFYASRSWVSSYVGTLPDSVRTLASAHIEQRTTKKPMLGEIALAIVEELFCTEPSVREQIRPAWLKLYWSSLFLDDLLDKRAGHQAAILSTLFLQSALNDVHRLFPNDTSLPALIERYCMATADSVTVQLTNPGVKYSGVPLDEYAGKLAFLKIAAAALFLGSNREPSADDYSLLDQASFAVQLLDDLTDYAEDWQVGSRTMPLVGWSDVTMPASNAASTQFEALHISIVSGVFARCIALALSTLEQVRGRMAGKASVFDYLLNITVTWTRLLVEVQAYERNSLQNPMIDLPRLKQLDRKIKIVAQSS